MPRFHRPLIEPDRQISRIRLSDKTSCFRPREVADASAEGVTAECAISAPSSMTLCRHYRRRPLPAGGFLELRFESSLRFHMVCSSQLLKKTPELRRVAPISTPSLLRASALNQGSFPPPALPGFSGTTSLSATPRRPTYPSPEFGWSSPTTPRASRVACAFLVYVLSPLPRHSHWRHCFAHPSSRVSLPRIGCRVGPRIVLFEACSAFTRVTACTLARPPNRGSLHPKASATSLPP